MKKKRSLTLLELMVVILLITLITGVIGYNMRGSLEKGKIFRTKQAKEQLHSMLLLAMEESRAKGTEIANNPERWIRDLGLAKNPDKLMQDGWGEKFTVTYNSSDHDFLITCPNDAKLN